MDAVSSKTFLLEVKKMRELQKKYFKDKTNADLFAAKAQEIKVDKMIKAHDTTNTLFDDERS